MEVIDPALIKQAIENVQNVRNTIARIKADLRIARHYAKKISPATSTIVLDALVNYEAHQESNPFAVEARWAHDAYQATRRADEQLEAVIDAIDLLAPEDDDLLEDTLDELQYHNTKGKP